MAVYETCPELRTRDATRGGHEPPRGPLLPLSAGSNDGITTGRPNERVGRPIDMRHRLRHREILYRPVPSTVRKVRGEQAARMQADASS